MEIEKFYNEILFEQLFKFIKGNKRIDYAMDTILRYSDEEPLNIIDLGCGIGDTTWKISNLFPNSSVTGIDISQDSIKLANILFGSKNLHFEQGNIYEFDTKKSFDLITLIDFYEHIELDKRSIVNELLNSILNENGKIILTYPSPYLLKKLYDEKSILLQPVDELIWINDLNKLSIATKTELIYYSYVSVWEKNDYVHAVLSKCGINKEINETINPRFFTFGSKEYRINLIMDRIKDLIEYKEIRLKILNSIKDSNFNSMFIHLRPRVYDLISSLKPDTEKINIEFFNILNNGFSDIDILKVANLLEKNDNKLGFFLLLAFVNQQFPNSILFQNVLNQYSKIWN
ncbi:MAG: class I SAM-dependent methyltransferase [Candidatus Kapabacteria bacterium]|nr:class I SAM-dependent methyltransferase [Ignavibacteriota bacterium]MCW5883933.1 class I SAM-dependent methyltransferase [Candidatus Kapabacteria bacterium]